MVNDKPFVRMNLEEEGKKQDIVNVYLNSDEREILNKAKTILEQKKDSTALKQIALVGANLIVSKNQAFILGVVMGNRRRNKRLNIVDFE